MAKTKKTKKQPSKDLDQKNSLENIKAFLNQGAKALFQFKQAKIHAVYVVPSTGDGYKVVITLDESEGVEKEAAVLDTFIKIFNNFGTIQPPEFNRSKELRMFSPYPVCAQYYNDGRELTVKGSCGPFIKKGRELYVLSCAHVLPNISKEVAVAQMHGLKSVYATVEHSDPSTDIAIAKFKGTQQNQWNFFPTQIVAPVVNEYVSHFGASSVEESGGYVKSTFATAKILDTTLSPPKSRLFYNLICLAIDSRHGDSGSPVVTNNNNIIGLIIGGDASKGEIYCSNLSMYALPVGLSEDNILLHGSKDRPWISEKKNRRREIELHMHSGRVIKNPTLNSYGEIFTKEGVSVLTHFDHSFDEEIDTKKEVWFFVVPLEHVVTPEEMVGANNLTPMLAINVSNMKRRLNPLAGLHRQTPCGTDTTIK